MVRVVLDVDHALRMRVPEVALVRRADVDFALVKRVRDLVRENAGGEARDDLCDVRFFGCVQHVVIDEDVVPEEGRLGGVVNVRTKIGHACGGCTLYFMFLKRPPTEQRRQHRAKTAKVQGGAPRAARWMT